MRALIGAVAVLILTGFTAAQDKKDDKKDKKDDKVDVKKLVGKWEPTDAPKGGPTVVVEFTDKGKLVLSADFMGKTEKLEGTYKVEGDKLEMVLTLSDKEQKETVTVTKLTDEEFTGKDAKGKEEKFKKLKGKG